MSAWLMVGLAFSVPFGGKPTHLACGFQGPANVAAIDVVVAPSNHAVAITIPSTGHAERHQATLSGTLLTFDSPLRYGNVNYAIDRSDLSIVRTETGPAAATVVTKGQCRILAAPKLNF